MTVEQARHGQRHATALGYNGTDAPRVLAAGTGDVALAIERLAAENQIPVIQDPGLSALLALARLNCAPGFLLCEYRW